CCTSSPPTASPASHLKNGRYSTGSARTSTARALDAFTKRGRLGIFQMFDRAGAHASLSLSPRLGFIMATTIWIDGQYCDKANAKISVFDHGLLYGDGVFEGIRVYNRRVFRLNKHLDRL